MNSVLRRSRVLGAVIVALLSLIALVGPVAAHGLPLPDKACNQGTERAFWDIRASAAVPMDATRLNVGEDYCMVMFDVVRGFPIGGTSHDR